nr:sulfotransferase [Arthrobacter castelli]
MRPGFLIAGAQRCGTTSLFRMLAEHPDVRPPLITKGIHYFDTADRFARGPEFYGGHFPLRRAGEQPATITGEASPYYLFHPLAAARIAAELPSVKVIVLLRDPIERAFSAYKQETGRGFETLPFEQALEEEPQRLDGEVQKMVADSSYQSFSHQHHAYVGRGQYAEQLERMFAAVGRPNVAVLDADQFLAPGMKQWPELMDFLELRHWNPTGPIQANSRPGPPMPQSVRDILDGQFDDSNERLPKILGYEPSWCR